MADNGHAEQLLDIDRVLDAGVHCVSKGNDHDCQQETTHQTDKGVENPIGARGFLGGNSRIDDVHGLDAHDILRHQ